MFLRVELQILPAHIAIVRLHRRNHILDRQVVLMQQERINLDLILEHMAAHAQNIRHTRHRL